MRKFTEEETKQVDRLAKADLPTDNVQVVEDYLKSPDILEDLEDGAEVPMGYKRCGGCKQIKKFYLFNVNNSSKNKCTGNCKECQRKSASKSYGKTKSKRNYKEYYANNKERKQENGRKYYTNHKEEILAKQKEYHDTSKGRKVMRNSHKKRKALLVKNKGIPYKREYVIDRDKMGGEFPVCHICEAVIQHEREIQLDHVIPVVLGGKDCFTNVACAHEICNLRKEKDARKLPVSHVEEIIERAEQYIEKHPELFE